MTIEKSIPASEWHKLKDIFADEFDSDLPDPKFAKIIGSYDNGKLVGFVLVERVAIIGQIFVAPEKRENNNGKTVRSLLKSVREQLPEGASVGAVASEPRFELLFKSLGLQKIAGVFFRRNN